MKLNIKSYKTNKIKNYIKTNQIFFLYNGNGLKSYDWIITEQKLKNMQFECYRVLNKSSIKTLDKSTFKQVKATINGITFFIKNSTNFKLLVKQSLIDNFEPLFLSLIALKINNKIYSNKHLKNAYSLKYKTNKFLLYQFNTIHLKFYYK